MKTEVATNIGVKDNANGVCALLSQEGQGRVAALVKLLSKELEEGVWYMLPEALHITVCEIMQAKPYPKDKEALFQANQNRYKRALEDVLSDVGPIQILFDRVEVSSQAIIIRGNDDHIFDSVRAELAKSLPLPPETKRPPTIVHCSIARFTKELDLAMVESVVAKTNILFTETVGEIQLMHNVSPHNLNYEVAARFPLRSQ